MTDAADIEMSPGDVGGVWQQRSVHALDTARRPAVLHRSPRSAGRRDRPPHTRGMTDTLAFDDVSAVALETDSDVLARVTALVRNAIKRQVWLMFLDSDRRQLPVLLPTEIPASPGDEDAELIGSFISTMTSEVDAATVVITLERPGTPELTDTDRAWLETLSRAAEASGIPYHGPYLCHRRGVRSVKVIEYRF